MAVTCQHCGSEAPDDRVMCPNCGRKMRPDGEPAETSDDTQPTTEAYGVPPAPGATGPADPWAMPGAAATSGEPPRPQLRYARDVITKASRLRVAFRLILVIPHLIALVFVGIAFLVVGVVAWFAALFLGRLPTGMHNFM